MPQPKSTWHATCDMQQVKHEAICNKKHASCNQQPAACNMSMQHVHATSRIGTRVLRTAFGGAIGPGVPSSNLALPSSCTNRHAPQQRYPPVRCSHGEVTADLEELAGVCEYAAIRRRSRCHAHISTTCNARHERCNMQHATCNVNRATPLSCATCGDSCSLQLQHATHEPCNVQHAREACNRNMQHATRYVYHAA